MRRIGRANGSGVLTWTGSYEGYGKVTKESGTNADTQRGNSKEEEDEAGLLNEGFRYRDIETGVWLSRDPAGFVDGPDLYAYVKQNPWTMWDPEGLYSWDLFKSDVSMFTSGVGNMWKGYGDVTVGAAIGAADAVVSLPSNVATVGSNLWDISQQDLGTLGSAGTGAAMEIRGNMGQAASDFGGRLAQGDERTWGQAVGTVLTMGGPGAGKTLQAFQLGLREGKAIGLVKDLAVKAAKGEGSGCANVMITADGQVFSGLSKNLKGGPVSSAVETLYGSARKTCAEARTLTSMEVAKVSPQGAVSASASVNLPKLPTGTLMEVCGQACSPVLKNLKIGDAVAETSPVLPYMPPPSPLPAAKLEKEVE